MRSAIVFILAAGTNALRVSPSPAQCQRRALLTGAAAACTLLAPDRAHAGYALQAANVAQHNWEATGKDKERAVYKSIQESIDAKRPDRCEAGELGYCGGEYTKAASRARDDFDQMLSQQEAQGGATSLYARPEDILGATARVTASPRAQLYK